MITINKLKENQTLCLSLDFFSDDEIRYLYDIITHKCIIIYFKNNAKAFNKICPGFRTNSISEKRAKYIVVTNRNKHFISSFFEGYLEKRLLEIKNHYDDCVCNGDSHIAALLHTLPYSVFCDNINLYLKVIQDDMTIKDAEILYESVSAIVQMKEKELRLTKEINKIKEQISESEISRIKSNDELAKCKNKLNTIKSIAAKANMLEADVKDKKQVIEQLQNQYSVQQETIIDLQRNLNKLNFQFSNSEATLKKSSNEVVKYKEKLKSITLIAERADMLEFDVKDAKQTIIQLRNENSMQQEIITNLRHQINDLKSNQHMFKEQMHTEIAINEGIKSTLKMITNLPKKPNDIEEFKEYFGYNLENIGVQTSNEGYTMLIKYLCDIVFRGEPIVINFTAGTNIAKCISNSLVGESNINCLNFKKNISIDDIDKFLSSCGRIACLNNFFGNYNEMELIPLFNTHRNKILFITTSYERTLNYVSKEFFRYCHYVNVNRIQALFFVMT